MFTNRFPIGGLIAGTMLLSQKLQNGTVILADLAARDTSLAPDRRATAL